MSTNPFAEALERGEKALMEAYRTNAELLEALRRVTDHFAAVMSGPMIAGRGVQFENGVEGIPTIAAARAAIAKAEGA